MLSHVPLFDQLSADALQGLTERMRRRRYARGSTIFFQGDPGLWLCIVQTGRVKLRVSSVEGREMIIDLLEPGEVFGELAVLDGEPRSADAVAVEPTELLMLDREQFVRFLLERPSIAVQLLGILSRRLRRDTQLIQDAAFLDVPARLARTILRLAVEPPDGGPPITHRLNQSDLAGLAGTTRETLNKWLGIYEDQGLIRREKGRIAVLDPMRLNKRIL
jgi:CRP/FNR family transcriptional regulator, cyclic AMP receptor protein